ncbi:MAG: hypothetical protein HFE51_04985 [Clostridia bacterium]|nr:hypothetical protein [Clostridia bacterium]
MYLYYDEYQNMGGTLDMSAFTLWERKAEYEINSQAAGRTGTRISNAVELTGLPQAVKDCTFDLVQFLSANAIDSKTVTSESQSSGGVSESYSYNVLDKSQIRVEIDDIIYNAFYGCDIGYMLYRGLLPNDV